MLFAGFLVFGNLSLRFNNVAFFTMAKMMAAPSVIAIDYVLFGKTVSRQKLLSVLVLVAGIMLANGEFGWAHPFGASIAILAFVIAAMYQIWIAKKMRELNVSAAQLLLNQAPLSVGLLLCLVPLFDVTPDFSEHVRCGQLSALVDTVMQGASTRKSGWRYCCLASSPASSISRNSTSSTSLPL